MMQPVEKPVFEIAVSSTVEYSEYSNVGVHPLDFILDWSIPI
jgi:hypothetical protein